MKKSIAIFGGGPASLALASFLDPDLFHIIIYEQNKTCGRKFLVAGKGGFNLTHSEPIETLKERYIPSHLLAKSLDHFTNSDLRSWLDTLGIQTFIGSSKRIFPVKGIKPIEVLDKILKHIESRGVNIRYQAEWQGWNQEENPFLKSGEEIITDYVVFGLGGGSWKITGSTGSWFSKFQSLGIGTKAFEPSNCAFKVKWTDDLLNKIEGRPIKNIAVKCGGKSQTGELVSTKFGLEGNAIYALSHNIRAQLKHDGKASISIDLKPMLSFSDISKKAEKSKAKNNTEFLKKDLNLSQVQLALIKNLTTKEEFIDRQKLPSYIKEIKVEILSTAPIDEAISTVGGIETEELTQHFELKKLPNSFCIGEMVDWDAPTGGYLLQGCFSMGAYLAHYLNHSV